MGVAFFATAKFGRASSAAQPAAPELPAGLATERWDFEAKGIDDWTVVTGQWAVEDMADAPTGKRVLVQRAVKK